MTITPRYKKIVLGHLNTVVWAAINKGNGHFFGIHQYTSITLYSQFALNTHDLIPFPCHSCEN